MSTLLTHLRALAFRQKYFYNGSAKGTLTIAFCTKHRAALMKVFYWGKFTRYKWYSKQFLSPFLTYLQIGIDKFAYIYEVIQDTEWPHKQVRGSNQEKLKFWLIYSYVSFFVVWHLTWPHWQKSRLWMKGAEQNCDKHMGYLQIEHIQSIQSETTIKKWTKRQ